MALRTLEALKSYFFEHAYPTWQQFHDVLDSFRHKSDKIPITDVDGLTEQLNGRVTNSELNEEIQARTNADTTLQSEIASKSSSEDLHAEIQARKDANVTLQSEIASKAGSDDLNAEIQARQDADTAILGDVTDETNARITAEAILRAAIDDARAIAEGRSKGKVFETLDDMNSWLAVSTNTASLNIGDHLLIKALNVPDYWWDGTGIQKLETEKVDLTDYVQKERKINGRDLYADVNLTADDIAETSSRGWLTSVLKSTYDGAVSWISTNGANLVAHLSDAVVHITATERTKWNNATVIQGSSFIFVPGNDTDVNNAAALQAAYTAAKSKTPFGSALSTTNRYTILIGAGTYTFSTAFTIDTQYIDIVSISGSSDVCINGISITANDVYVKGLNCGTNVITIATGLANLKMDNSISTGDYSFSSNDLIQGYVLSGVFTNCTGGNYSFGGVSGTASGKITTTSGRFTNCTGGDYSFGGGYASKGSCSSTVSGTFNNCTGGNYSFGGGSYSYGYNLSSTVSGTFTNCIGGNYSFGYTGAVTGNFYYCKAGMTSFGGSCGASGTFYYCTAGYSSFGASGASGIFYYCTAGYSSFGGSYTASGIFSNCVCTGTAGFGSNASGTFTNCISGDSSFGSSNSTGTFIRCKGGNYSFGDRGGTASGIFRNCDGGNASFCGKANGTFTNCTAGDESFGCADRLGGGASGTFINCTAGESSFGIIKINPPIIGSATGTFINCKAGNYSFGGYNTSNSTSSYTGVASGKFKNCIAGTYSFGGSLNSSNLPGICSGTFIDCMGDVGSFGSTIAATALLYNCYLTSGTFQTPITGGLIRNCLDGTKTIINT
jgi:hypothetical protein